MAFLSSGLTTAVLNSDGTLQEKKQSVMMFVRARRRSMFSQGSDVGNRSSSQVFFAVFLRMLCTSFSDAGVN